MGRGWSETRRERTRCSIILAGVLSVGLLTATSGSLAQQARPVSLQSPESSFPAPDRRHLLDSQTTEQTNTAERARLTQPIPRAPLAKSPTPLAPRLVRSYGRLPLSFEENQGQVDSQVEFLARGRGYTLFLTPTEAVLSLRSSDAKEKVEREKAKVGIREELGVRRSGLRLEERKMVDWGLSEK